MSITYATYSGLKSKILLLYPRGDLTAELDDFIAAAEAEFNRVLRLPDMVTTNQALAASTRFTNLPSGFLEMLRVQLNEGGKRRELKFLGEEGAPRITDGTTGTPTHWTVVGTTLELLPSPGSSITLDVSYFAAITSVIGGSPNFLMTAHPDLYLYRALYEAAIARGDDKRMQRYSQAYTNVLSAVQRAGKRARYGRAMAIRAA